MHHSIDKKNKILIYLIFLIFLSTISNKQIENQKYYFAKINKIYIHGLSKKNNLKLKKQLDYLLLKNIFFINNTDIKKIISKNNLVESYSVKKIYPSQININIKQTQFLAEIIGDNQFLVGSNGKLISQDNIKGTLPILFGKFNSQRFLEFKKIIDQSSFNFKDFKSILFYPSNRWDIQTTNDITIKLPEQQLSEALRMAYRIFKDDKFKNNRVIDLRISNHIILQNEK